MKSYEIHDERLNALLSPNDELCISVIVPVHATAAQRQNDAIEVKNALNDAKEYLLHNYGNDRALPLIGQLNEIEGGIDYTHNSYGIGIYVSASVQQLWKFHFPVTKKVIVGRSFEVRDALYENSCAAPYFLLLLTEKEARLFSGRLNRLTEIHDSTFPKEYAETYSYQQPDRMTAGDHAFTKSFEKDRSVIQETRLTQFFRSVDKAIDNYVVNGAPLIVSAGVKELAWYKNATAHPDRIAHTIPGNYAHELNTLAEKAWMGIQSLMDTSRKNLLAVFEEKIGEGLGVDGLEQAWRAVAEGRGMTLMVEKDYRKIAVLNNGDSSRLQMHAPAAEHRFLADAVDELIRSALGKGGDIVFVENGALADHQHIGLIARYV